MSVVDDGCQGLMICVNDGLCVSVLDDMCLCWMKGARNGIFVSEVYDVSQGLMMCVMVG